MIYLPLCNVRGLWAHFRILPQCYWLLPWTNLAPSIGFPLCQFCQWTFYVSGKKRRVEKATFHEIRKRFFAYFADQIEYLRIWNLLRGLDFDFDKCPKLEKRYVLVFDYVIPLINKWFWNLLTSLYFDFEKYHELENEETYVFHDIRNSIENQYLY